MDRIIPITPIVDGVVQAHERYIRLSTVENVCLTTLDAHPDRLEGEPLSIKAVALSTQQGTLYAKYPFHVMAAWAELFDPSCLDELEALRQSTLARMVRQFLTQGLSQDWQLLEHDGRYYGTYNGCITRGDYERQSALTNRCITYHIGIDSSDLLQGIKQSGLLLSREALMQLLTREGIEQPSGLKSIADMGISADLIQALNGSRQWALNQVAVV